MKPIYIAVILTGLVTQVAAHSGGLNKLGCHAGSKPYHCHRSPNSVPTTRSNQNTISGKVTHVRDGDTVEVNGIAIRLSALDCPENDTRQGQRATQIAKQLNGAIAVCELTGARSYDRLVGYCTINGTDFGQYMMDNSACRVWKKYDVWDRY